MSDDERVAAMRARLEAKHEELVTMLASLGANAGHIDAKPGTPGSGLFYMLGIVAYWSALPKPPDPHLCDFVNAALDQFDMATARHIGRMLGEMN